MSEIAKTHSNGPEDTANNLDQIAHSARQALGSISELVWRLEPANDNLEHFTAHLEHLAGKTLHLSGVQLTLDIPDELPEASVSSTLRTELAFMVTEVLRNVVEHAAATQVTIQLRFESGDTFNLAIADNGRGFATTSHLETKPNPATLRGNGLGNLHARAAQFGGQVQIESTMGQGTKVIITAPLNHPNN
jgi:signal transduction histidine kinase